ncbi:MAG TPA: hypothetical protein VI874_05550, partial [Candidatus Norongarragalinales archaeon]|nr:hypothetical protein [Candidatus Norongarragalinales archaeon]
MEQARNTTIPQTVEKSVFSQSGNKTYSRKVQKAVEKENQEGVNKSCPSRGLNKLTKRNTHQQNFIVGRET